MKTRRNILGYTSGIGVLACTNLTFASGCSPQSATDKSLSPTMPESKFSLPPEDAPHERTFMQWPSRPEIYENQHQLRQAQSSIALIANAISEFEPVVMLAPEEKKSALNNALSATVEHWAIPTDDLWCRDSGPCFVHDASGTLSVMNFNFNGWGRKQRHKNDRAIAQKVALHMGLEIIDSGLTGEPGGLDADGSGTLIAHESSWVNKNRNHLDRNQIEQSLLIALGAKKIIWAPGLAGYDITDYHIDALARFVAPGRILIQLPKVQDHADPFSVAAYQTYEILKNATDATGRKFQIDVIPEPLDTRAKSDEFVASYVNYYVCNGAVIAAEFGDPKADEQAHAVLKSLYPNREIIMLNIDPIGEIGGGIHCATQQQPKVQI